VREKRQFVAILREGGTRVEICLIPSRRGAGMKGREAGK
jgi:hypothetical protein